MVTLQRAARRTRGRQVPSQLRSASFIHSRIGGSGAHSSDDLLDSNSSALEFVFIWEGCPAMVCSPDGCHPSAAGTWRSIASHS